MSSIYRFDLLERGWHEAIEAATGTAHVWAYGAGGASSLGAQWVESRIFSGPVAEFRPLAAGRILPNVTIATLQITSSAAGDYRIDVNGYPAAYTTDGSETIEQVRDALLLLVAAMSGAENAAAAVSTDSISLTPSVPGALRSVVLGGSVVLASHTDAGAVRVSEISALVGVESQCFSRVASGPASNAVAVAADVASIFRSPARARALAGYGIKPRDAGIPTDLSDLPNGGAWEGRRSVLMGLSIPAVDAEIVPLVSSLAISLIIRDGAGATIETLSITG